MNPVQLLAHFDRISDAPDAIPRLRRFILDLAVRGKLVEQDSNDEPAKEVFAHLKTCLRSLYQNGKAARRAAVDRANDGVAPSSFPNTWELTHFDEVNAIV